LGFCYNCFHVLGVAICEWRRKHLTIVSIAVAIARRGTQNAHALYARRYVSCCRSPGL
jgi:hypothetical protein